MIASFYAFGAPPSLLWPIVVAICAGAISLLIYLRARNLLLYVLVSAGSGCLTKGGLGVAIRTHGQVNDPEYLNHAAWDILLGGNDTIDIALIVAGVLLFAMALFRESIANQTTTPIFARFDTSPDTDQSRSNPVSDLNQSHQNPLHRIIDLLICYQSAFDTLHHANSRDAMIFAMDDWQRCHGQVWGNGNVRDETIRNLADPAKEWLSKKKNPYVQLQDFDMLEECVHILSGFAVSPSPMAMPDIYSKEYHTQDELWKRWEEQGNRLLALAGLIARMKELTARAGAKWTSRVTTGDFRR